MEIRFVHLSQNGTSVMSLDITVWASAVFSNVSLPNIREQAWTSNA